MDHWTWCASLYLGHACYRVQWDGLLTCRCVWLWNCNKKGAEGSKWSTNYVRWRYVFRKILFPQPLCYRSHDNVAPRAVISHNFFPRYSYPTNESEEMKMRCWACQHWCPLWWCCCGHERFSQRLIFVLRWLDNEVTAVQCNAPKEERLVMWENDRQ